MALVFHWGSLDFTSLGQSRPPSVNEVSLNRSIFTNTLLRESMRWQHQFVLNQERSHPTAVLSARFQDHPLELGVLPSGIKSRGQQIRLLEIHQLVLELQWLRLKRHQTPKATALWLLPGLWASKRKARCPPPSLHLWAKELPASLMKQHRGTGNNSDG